MPPEAINLLGGAYVSRSRVANYQRSINYFPEINRKDSPRPVTLYQRPGLVPLAQGPNAPVRCLFPASNGQGYCVIGQNFYRIGQNFQLYQLGQLKFQSNNPVSISDNGTSLVLADGSQLGYTYALAGTGGFQQIVDPTGTFVGANRWDYIDTFLIWNSINTPTFGSTLSNGVKFDALYTAAKTTYPDLLVTLYVNRHQIMLFGQYKTEVWYDAGGALFPFAQNPGVYIEHGCAAPYSVASADIEVFWLGQDLQGARMVFAQQGYQTKRISNHSVEVAMRKMGTVADAIGYTYQQDGHVFYVLSFPTANKTLVFDATVEEPSMAWHERAWTDGNGMLNRDRTNAHAPLFGKNVVGDWENGTIYEIDPETYVDNVGGVQSPLTCIRGFPHLQHGMESGQLSAASGRNIAVNKFQLDLECGDAPLDVNGNPAEITMRYSNDRGRTWSQNLLQSAGAPGEYTTKPNWAGASGLGFEPVYEIEHSIAGPAALGGAWITSGIVGN